MSKFRFDGEGGTFIAKYISPFLGLYKPQEIYDEDGVCILVTLTLEGLVKKWVHTFPIASIHSFDRFLKDIHQEFDKYDYEYVCDSIDPLKMKYNESIEDFINWFLHFCYEFHVEYFNYNFISERFQSLIILPMKSFTSEPFNDCPIPNYVDDETPQICEEEPAIPFFPCPPPFPISILVSPSEDVEVEKYENWITNPSIQPPPISHDLIPIEDNLEWFNNFIDPKVKVYPLDFEDHISKNKSNI